MDSHLIPFFFFPQSTDSCASFLPFGYGQIIPTIDISYGSSFEMEQDFKTEDSSKESKKEDFELWSRAASRKSSVLKIEKQEEDRFSVLPLKESINKKLEIKPRQQTVNRNLGSNTLKVYFKQLRDSKSETFLNLSTIILMNKVEISKDKFMEKLSTIFPQNATYICFDDVKRFCSNYKANENKEFAKIFRVSLKRFFKYEIFAVNLKSVRTTRQIRNQQIQQGKMFLKELFH